MTPFHPACFTFEAGRRLGSEDRNRKAEFSAVAIGDLLGRDLGATGAIMAF